MKEVIRIESMIFLVDSDKKKGYLTKLEKTNKLATFELYRKLLNKLDEFEEYKGISATNMTKLDFIEFLTTLNSSSLSVLYTYKSALNSYLIFATDKQKFTIGILELEKITQDDLLDCINKSAESQQFITEDEYFDILVGDDGNWQDKAVLVLLWNGIKGETQFSEILNLKKLDIDIFKNTIKVEDRIVEITNFEMDVIKNAIHERIYVKKKMDKKGLISTVESEYVEGEYLIKNTIGRYNKYTETNQCGYGTFANRMTKFYNITLKQSNLTNQRVYKSAIYYRMLKENGRLLTLGELLEYLDKHNLRISQSNFYREQEIMYNKMVEQGIFK